MNDNMMSRCCRIKQRHGESSIYVISNHDAIVSCTLADQQQKLTEHFLELFKNQQSTVVVSQSWNEIHKVNEQVRLGLRTQKLIGEAMRGVHQADGRALFIVGHW